MRPRRCQQIGSVTLVALCFVAVLGIALASYLAVSNQAMKLSNRTFQTGVSEQLAEMGLERALNSFNLDDWSGWKISGTTATRTVTFASNKYGAIGVTGSINLRVDNYNAFNLSSVWDATTLYKIDDLVGLGGIWYRCVQDHATNNHTPPDLTYWAAEPIPWKWNTGTYNAEDVVNYNGVWYRATANTSTAPPSANWTPIPIFSIPWDSDIKYIGESITYYDGNWYRRRTGPSVNAQPSPQAHGIWPDAEISWRWRNDGIFAFNDVVYYNDVWYRCILAHTNQTPPNPTYWANALAMWGWSSSEAYNLNDAVYYSGSWYRCILAHTNQTPPNPTCWANAPLLSNAWNSRKTYAANDIVSYGNTWYRCILANTAQTPPNANWVSASTTSSSTWSAATSYVVNDYASYGGVWYRCLSAHTNKTPNNATYWSASKAPVIYAEGVATLPGGSNIKTQLRATVAPAPLFPNAAGASTTLSVSGGGTVDSYDSNRGTYASQVGTSTNYSAVMAAGSTSGTAITLSSTAVKGYIAAPSGSSSPYAPLFSSGGSVKGFSSPASPNIDLTRLSRSPYIPQFDTLPTGGLAANWATTPKGTALVLSATTNIGTPGATTPSRYYYDGNLTLGVASALTILNINGPVILYINGNLTMDGSPNGIININSAGSAEIHIANSLKVNINSEGFINNTLDPKKLILICDTSASSTQNYSDGTVVIPFYGVIYLPNTTNSTGLLFDNTSTQINGAISAKKITYSGANANIHYDTSLRYATFGGVDQPYAITEWRELTDPAEKVTLP